MESDEFRARYRRILGALRMAVAAGALPLALASAVRRCAQRMEGLGDDPAPSNEAYNLALEGAELIEAISVDGSGKA